MKTSLLISVYLGVEQNPYRVISKNEPNRSQIQQLIRNIFKTIEIDVDIVYTGFEQPYRDNKKYSFTVNGIDCTVTVERLNYMEFEK